MVRSLAVTLVGGAALFGTVFFVFYRDAHQQAVKPANPSDVTVSIAQARRDFPTALLPASTPRGWTITAVRYAPTDPSATSGPSVLHIGYVTAQSHGHYVDFEVGASIDDALGAFDGDGPKPTGTSVRGLQELKAPDGTYTLRTATGVSPAIGLTGSKDAADLSALASVLSARSSG